MDEWETSETKRLQSIEKEAKLEWEKRWGYGVALKGKSFHVGRWSLPETMGLALRILGDEGRSANWPKAGERVDPADAANEAIYGTKWVYICCILFMLECWKRCAVWRSLRPKLENIIMENKKKHQRASSFHEFAGAWGWLGWLRVGVERSVIDLRDDWMYTGF